MRFIKIIVNIYKVNFITIYVLCLIICLKDFINSLPFDNFNYNNIYGEGYGEDWIFIPDGNGIPHYVDLRKPEYNFTLDIRGISAYDVVFRLYLGNDTKTYIKLDEWARPIHGEYPHDITYVLTLSDKPLKIVTHGWKSSADNEGVTVIKNAYIESKEANVVTIDWSGIADSIFYHWVVEETKAIGAKVATFITELNIRHNVSRNQFHLIGHSLGAHIMGIAATKLNFVLDRITGLDPARPLFEYPGQNNLVKLDPSDAVFVDVIHTCGGVLGVESPIGTVDFYPNNGTPPQPGCESLQKILEACSHGRSFQFFSESIKYPLAFPARQCSSWNDFLDNRCNEDGYMGEGSVKHKMSGKYYLKTNPSKPYGLRLK